MANNLCRNKSLKPFSIRYERSKAMRKDLPSLSGRDITCARTKEIAKKKWRREFPLSPKPKVISAVEIK